MKTAVLCYIGLINLFGAFLCFRDKRAAVKGKWRVAEKDLFLTAFLGGGLGVLIGMLLLRHKTRHLKFMLGMPLIMLLNGAVFFSLLRMAL